MDIFSIITILVHIIAILALISTIPHQIQDIWQESDVRYRKICWVIFIGTICLLSTNVLPLLSPLFYNSPREMPFNNIVSIFNALIGIILGSLAHIMYNSSKKTIPRTIEDIDRHAKSGKT